MRWWNEEPRRRARPYMEVALEHLRRAAREAPTMLEELRGA